MENDQASSRCSSTSAAASCWSPARDGHGFVVPEDECVANTRKGKQVMNVDMPDEASAIATVAGDTVAVVGENRKMLLFPARAGAGDGARQGRAPAEIFRRQLSDVTVFDAKDGLTWKDSAGRDHS